MLDTFGDQERMEVGGVLLGLEARLPFGPQFGVELEKARVDSPVVFACFDRTPGHARVDTLTGEEGRRIHAASSNS